jgi:hypothetical protein
MVGMRLAVMFLDGQLNAIRHILIQEPFLQGFSPFFMHVVESLSLPISQTHPGEGHLKVSSIIEGLVKICPDMPKAKEKRRRALHPCFITPT